VTAPDNPTLPHTAAPGRPDMRLRVRLSYAGIGLLIGGAWALGWSQPAWQHALRLLVVVLVVPPLMPLLHRFTRRSAPAHPPLRYLVPIKIGLVAAALGLEVLLQQWTPWANLMTALALAAAVAIGGPPLHRKLPPNAPPNQRSPSLPS